MAASCSSAPPPFSCTAAYYPFCNTSLPEAARWEYNHQVKEGSPEAEIMDAFKNPREWA